MPKVAYGNKTIDYSFLKKEGLKSHYISVQKGNGVVLKGKVVSLEKSQQLVLKKARWILDKLDLVKSIGDDDIVTGSRIQYLGKKYYVEIIIDNNLPNINIDFTASKFKIYTSKEFNNQAKLTDAFRLFFKHKAVEKIAPRVIKWSKETGLNYNELKFRNLDKRWGSCTPSNNIIINII